MKRFKVSFKATRKGQSIYMLGAVDNFPANNVDEVMAACKVEWERRYDGEWVLEVIRWEVVGHE